MLSRSLLITLFCILACFGGSAQTVNPNIDFELGNFSNWHFFTGTCCPLSTPDNTPAVYTRHTLVSSASLDPYGNFPVLAPDGGEYSLRLGNDSVNAQAERARYYIHVPSDNKDYSLSYRFAVVFEDPGHKPEEQPRFVVNTFDSTTNEPIKCAQFTYVADSNLPGFHKSTAGAGDVLYKEWSTATINLSGHNGTTVIVDFSTGDCALGGHFGYAYLDVANNLFTIATTNCDSQSITLSGPDGYMTYSWYDSSLKHFIIDSNKIVIPNPDSFALYAVILHPYPGYGCMDTIFSTIKSNNLIIEPLPDFANCAGSPNHITVNATDPNTPLTYAWVPAKGIACNTCRSIVAYPEKQTEYVVTVTNANGCSKTDTFNAYIEPCDLIFPNAFTPNNDGRNDIARVIGDLSFYTDFSLSIYNRWGQRVFYTTDIYAGWDGQYNGIYAEFGTYFYMILYSLNGHKHMLKGDLTLIR